MKENDKRGAFWKKCFLFLLMIFLSGFLIWLLKMKKTFQTELVEKNIELKEGNLFFQATTSAKTVGDFLTEQKIVLSQEDLIYPGASSEISFGQRIKILHPQNVLIEVDGKTLEKKVFSSRIFGALIESGINLAPLDRIQPSSEKEVLDGMKIVITRVEIEEKEEEEKISFATTEKNNPDLAWRKKEIKQKGEEGIRKVKYRLTYKNGKLTTKEKLSQVVEKKPVAEIVSVGTKVKVGQTKVGVASWYAHTGTMACASRMFPRGTWLRVTSRENGKQIFVVVNDYGPMRGTGKMIDLDKVAFEKLASLGKGVVEVKVEEIVE